VISTLGKAFVQRDRYDLLSPACLAAALAECRGPLTAAAAAGAPLALPRLQLLHGAADATVPWADTAAFALAAASAGFEARVGLYPMATSQQYDSTTLYRFPITFSGCLSKATIGLFYP
jgi:hypothetical protein